MEVGVLSGTDVRRISGEHDRDVAGALLWKWFIHAWSHDCQRLRPLGPGGADCEERQETVER